MERFLAWAFVVLSLALVGLMARQAYTGKHSLLSLRNVFLVGVIVFQLTSAASAFFTGAFGNCPPAYPASSGVTFLILISLFLGFFLLVYERRWFTFGIQRRIRISMPVPGTAALVAVSIASLGAAAICRLVFADIGAIGVLAEIASGAFAAMAAGAASWAWAGRPKSIGLILYLLIAVAAAAAVTTFEAFGRREIVSVMVGCLWGVYHGGFKYANIKRAAIPLVGIGLAGFFLVAAFTSTRGDGVNVPSITERLRKLPEADIMDGALQLLGGQDAAPNSMWLIESRPDPYPYDTLASLEYFLVHPIPRVIWEDKPQGLGTLMVRQSMATGVGETFSLGAGLVGHIVNDNPWIALPLYAIILGAWLRILDDLLLRFPYQPYLVLSMGIELGEIIGMPRGELGFFAFRAVAGMAFAYFGTLMLAKMLRAMGFTFYAAPEESAPPVENAEPQFEGYEE